MKLNIKSWVVVVALVLGVFFVGYTLSVGEYSPTGMVASDIANEETFDLIQENVASATDIVYDSDIEQGVSHEIKSIKGLPIALDEITDSITFLNMKTFNLETRISTLEKTVESLSYVGSVVGMVNLNAGSSLSGVVINTCGNGVCDAGEQTTCEADCKENGNAETPGGTGKQKYIDEDGNSIMTSWQINSAKLWAEQIPGEGDTLACNGVADKLNEEGNDYLKLGVSFSHKEIKDEVVCRLYVDIGESLPGQNEEYTSQTAYLGGLVNDKGYVDDSADYLASGEEFLDGDLNFVYVFPTESSKLCEGESHCYSKKELATKLHYKKDEFKTCVDADAISSSLFSDEVNVKQYNTLSASTKEGILSVKCNYLGDIKTAPVEFEGDEDKIINAMLSLDLYEENLCGNGKCDGSEKVYCPGDCTNLEECSAWYCNKGNKYGFATLYNGQFKEDDGGFNSWVDDYTIYSLAKVSKDVKEEEIPSCYLTSCNLDYKKALEDNKALKMKLVSSFGNGDYTDEGKVYYYLSFEGKPSPLNMDYVDDYKNDWTDEDKYYAKLVELLGPDYGSVDYSEWKYGNMFPFVLHDLETCEVENYYGEVHEVLQIFCLDQEEVFLDNSTTTYLDDLYLAWSGDEDLCDEHIDDLEKVVMPDSYYDDNSKC